MGILPAHDPAGSRQARPPDHRQAPLHGGGERRSKRPALALARLLRPPRLPRVLLGLRPRCTALPESRRAARGGDRDLRLARQARQRTGRLPPQRRAGAARTRGGGGHRGLLGTIGGPRRPPPERPARARARPPPPLPRHGGGGVRPRRARPARRSEPLKAVVMTALGGPEVLELKDVERPEPIPTEVLVRITAAGINPVDWKTRAHGGFESAVGQPPLILGWDIAGVVEEVDPDVTRFSPGDRVFGMPWFPRIAGAYAEYATSPARQLARTPISLTDEQPGGLPLAGLTAWQALVDVAQVGPGTRVLIHAAAGGVGHLAAQIASSRGAHVIGTAREEKHDFLGELGVDEPIDYSAGPFEEAVSEVDVVLDLVGGEDYGLRSLETLRDGG